MMEDELNKLYNQVEDIALTETVLHESVKELGRAVKEPNTLNEIQETIKG